MRSFGHQYFYLARLLISGPCAPFIINIDHYLSPYIPYLFVDEIIETLDIIPWVYSHYVYASKRYCYTSGLEF